MTDVDVPDHGSLAIVLDDFDGRRPLHEDLLSVFARWWLLFGRMQPVLVRTDDSRYLGPSDLGVTPAEWNRREWLTADRID